MLDRNDPLQKYVNYEASKDNLYRIIENQIKLLGYFSFDVAELASQDWWYVSKFSRKQLDEFLRALTSGKENCCGGKVRHPNKESATDTLWRGQNVYWCPYCNHWHTGNKIKFENNNYTFSTSQIYTELQYIKDDALRYEIERYFNEIKTTQAR